MMNQNELVRALSEEMELNGIDGLLDTVAEVFFVESRRPETHKDSVSSWEAAGKAVLALGDHDSFVILHKVQE